MYQNQNKGIIAGLISGVFWGTPFVVPMILHQYSAIDITMGRFIWFGFISLLFIRRTSKVFLNLELSEQLWLMFLATTGFWLYTLIIYTGILHTNGVIGALILGNLPVTIVLFSHPKINKRFISGLALVLIGVLALAIPNLLDNLNPGLSLGGVLYLLLGLVMWTWFAIKNAKFMQRNYNLTTMDYSSIIGTINIIFMIPIYFYGYHKNFVDMISLFSDLHYVFWCAVVGIGASWIANIFWAYSAKNCPSSIGGVLMVSEMIFGLLYSLIYEMRLPVWNEVFASTFSIVGAIIVILSQRSGGH